VESPQNQQFDIVATRLSRYLADEDRATHPAAVLEGIARSMIELAQVRHSGDPLVRSLTPANLPAHLAVLQVSTDDMPFLVDSVSAMLLSAHHDIHLVLHPQFVVRRAADGTLREILDLDVDDALPEGTVAESWMWVEYALDPDMLEGTAVDVDARRVLSDVRAAVSDWSAMRDRALAIATELEAAPPWGMSAGMVLDGVDFLRWLCDDNFTFLGYQQYDLVEPDGHLSLRPVPATGRGLLNEEHRPRSSTSRSFAKLSDQARVLATEPRLLLITKANSRSTVHRSSYFDYIGVKRFNDAGVVVGEDRFLGLFTSNAHVQSLVTVPLLRRSYDELASEFGYAEGGHDAKALLRFLETYPRDELFQIHHAELAELCRSVMHLQDRRHTKLYVRTDDFGRFVSCLVHLPRDRYTTAVRLRMQAILTEAYGGEYCDYTTRVTDALLARLHFVIRVPSGQTVPEVNAADLEAKIIEAARSWQDSFQGLLVNRVGDSEAGPMLRSFRSAFPEGYKERYAPAHGVQDALTISSLQPGELSLELHAPGDAGPRDLRLKITRVGMPMSLSHVLPILQSMGLDVVEEHPYEITRPMREPAWILDFAMVLPAGEIAARSTLPERLEETFLAAWEGRCAIDGFNALITRGGLRWREAMVLRAYARYLRQIGTTFSQSYIEGVLAGNVPTVRLLIDLFENRFARPTDTSGRDDRESEIVREIETELDVVASLDHDRILRSFVALILATLRTTLYQSRNDGSEPLGIALKLDPHRLAEVPLPRPKYEIWVHSPRVEGVHLRFGAVARGGLRWSDRQEDFRTEVLGLVKAQEVKNAVIVPVGAKGGFFARSLPDPAVDRDGWLAEGKAAYREFVSSMLDLTDNLVDGQVVPPRDTIRYDGDDPYLVVAADKGTATFSDLANSIALEHDFWLGDAFASGGSVGYDHKAMGITARGAWESVQRHFRDLGRNTQTQDFSVVGVGDMSGDVFGNGMLLSPHIRLVAAFDHRDIFLDPAPVPDESLAERRRLFALPRSSWQDYDAALVSPGGGVFSRSLKSIPLSPQIVEVLGLAPDTTALTPDEVISAILRAPVDLLWNGGIGTYVKARNQSHADVGDKANDRIRVNGDDLRCTVVGEGGNLGFTQLGRVEAARHGVRLNTDAIDNSAGVDTSDHEVNIKILLDAAVRSGELSASDRVDLLTSMSDDVAARVLSDNYGQNVVLGNARAGADALLSVHQRMIEQLEHDGLLDRALEFLPDDEEIRSRRLAGQGLTSPELSVLLAYSKIWLTRELNASVISDEPYFSRMVEVYFPTLLHDRFRAGMLSHPLRREIISTVTVNRLINIGGITFVFRAMEETGASAVAVVRAACASMEVFGIAAIWNRINEQDNLIPSDAQTALHLEIRRLLDRATRWFLQTRGGTLDVQREIEDFASVVSAHANDVPGMLLGVEHDRFDRLRQRFTSAGVPEELAASTAAALDVFSLLDITDICVETGEDVDTVTPLFFTITERYDIDRTLVHITNLPRGDRWSALARQALRSDLYAAVAGLTARVVRATPATQSAAERLRAWEGAHMEGVMRATTTLTDIAGVDDPDLATLSVALRALRNLVAQGARSHGGEA
jgi:glutamate dehydrogenase